MLDEIAEYMVSGKLQEVFMEDEEYRARGERQKEAAEQCYGTIPAQYHPLVEELMDCQNACAGRLVDMAYKQGMIDGAQMLIELGLGATRQ